MSTVKQEVVNAAMAHMGEPGFEDIGQDPPSAALVKVLAQLDGRAGAERRALSRHPWLCALSYLTLAPVSPAPTNWKWANAFLLPQTAVKVWEVDGPPDLAYEIGTETVGGSERSVIRANVGSLRVSFSEVKPYEAYSADLCNYIAFLLASRAIGPLKSDYEGAARLKKDAEAAALEAMSGEAGQHGGEDPRLASGLADLRRRVA
ncbi:hypothetical protein [Phenylobacterium sp. SCN 70-31]|uniref:hypothetical protein n=1 Tax=Phenylobacterium sp. SCN 70-31 TaxID=1660129 RepID=UPI00086BC3AB|nr:hypothetical protein [Phenylobacterium sp. SCN 70-31]ODT88109.1 MAG: hypothetical protein ABS78_09465 [Phenylobacterium sp. SCN 70-31]